jgi:phosphopantetheinyl transferase
MPIFKIINYNNTLVYIWKITAQSNSVLDLNLSEDSLRKYESFKSEQQKISFLSIQKLLNIAGFSDQDLYYLASGKPCLTDGTQLSISHAMGYSAIVISERRVGVDVEKFRPQLFKIKNKFLNKYEIHWLLGKESLEMLTILWCCKESLYKIYPHKGLSLKEINIKPFEVRDGVITGEILKEGWHQSYKIYVEWLDDHVLVYAIELEG